MNAILTLLSSLVSPVVDYFKQRAALKAQEAQHELDLKDAINKRQIDLMSQGLAADAAWELEFARQAASSWKDEYTLLVISIPAILCFIPGYDVYVKRGFDSMASTPAWYQLVFISIFLATYGIRYWRKNQSDT